MGLSKILKTAPCFKNNADLALTFTSELQMGLAMELQGKCCKNPWRAEGVKEAPAEEKIEEVPEKEEAPAEEKKEEISEAPEETPAEEEKPAKEEKPIEEKSTEDLLAQNEEEIEKEKK